MSETNNQQSKPIEKDYYFDNGFCVFTESFLIKRGTCCGNGCRHCPYQPKHQKGNVILFPEFVQKL